MYLAKAMHLIIASPSLCPTVSKPLEAPASRDVAGTSTPNPSAADQVACIIRGVLRPGSSLNAPRASSPVAAKAVPAMKKSKPQVPLVHYNRLTTSKRQEINDKVSDFYNTLSEYAASNGLNPAHVTRHAFGGELKGAKLNYWKCFQMIRGMARSDRKFIFRLCTYRIIEQNYRSVVVWDDALAKLVGRDAPARSAGGEGEGEKAGDEDVEDDDEVEDEDEDEDAEAEPDVPALLSDADFKYDPRDPVGLRLGKVSSDDTAQYHIIKSACIKAGQLEEWKQSLRNTVVELSSTLSTRSLTNARSKKAAKKITQELQHYVCPSALIRFRI